MADNSPLTTRVQRIAAIDARAKSAAPQKPDAVADWLLGLPFIIYYPDIARMLDSVPAAVLISKMWFWSNTPTAKERGGWFYWKQSDITRQTGLSRRFTDTAKRLLNDRGIIEIDLRGVPPVLWFRVDKQEFFEQTRVFIDSLEDSKEDS